jgi:hypothetical protein
VVVELVDVVVLLLVVLVDVEVVVELVVLELVVVELVVVVVPTVHESEVSDQLWSAADQVHLHCPLHGIGVVVVLVVVVVHGVPIVVG